MHLLGKSATLAFMAQNSSPWILLLGCVRLLSPAARRDTVKGKQKCSLAAIKAEWMYGFLSRQEIGGHHFSNAFLGQGLDTRPTFMHN